MKRLIPDRATLLGVSLAVVVLLGLFGCSRPGGPKIEGAEGAPVILISIDTLRSDRLPVYGYDQVETPHLDAFARDAITFDRVYSHTPLTLPSHASILSGKLPDQHGVRDNVGYDVPDDLVAFLPRDLRGRRVHDRARAVSAFVLRGETGIGNGFDFFEDDIRFRGGVAGGSSVTPGRRDAECGVARLGALGGGGEVLLLLSLCTSRICPGRHRSRSPRASKTPYDAEVAAADAVVGELIAELKALEVYSKAIIIVALGPRGRARQPRLPGAWVPVLYREDIQVPLLLKLPQSAAGRERGT